MNLLLEPWPCWIHAFSLWSFTRGTHYCNGLNGIYLYKLTTHIHQLVFTIHSIHLTDVSPVRQMASGDLLEVLLYWLLWSQPNLQLNLWHAITNSISNDYNIKEKNSEYCLNHFSMQVADIMPSFKTKEWSLDKILIDSWNAWIESDK